MYGSYSCQESFLRWWQWGVWVLGNEVMASWTGKSHLNGVLCPVPRRERKGGAGASWKGSPHPSLRECGSHEQARGQGQRVASHHQPEERSGLNPLWLLSHCSASAWEDFCPRHSGDTADSHCDELVATAPLIVKTFISLSLGRALSQVEGAGER
jgi:hypothetical protein